MHTQATSLLNPCNPIWYVLYFASVSVSKMMRIFYCLILLSNYLMNRTQRFCLMRRSKLSLLNLSVDCIYSDCMNTQEKTKYVTVFSFEFRSLSRTDYENSKWFETLSQNLSLINKFVAYYLKSILPIIHRAFALFTQRMSILSPIHIIHHDDQMEQSTCQSTENIATLPKHF